MSSEVQNGSHQTIESIIRLSTVDKDEISMVNCLFPRLLDLIKLCVTEPQVAQRTKFENTDVKPEALS